MTLMHSLFISIFLYACESWTLTVELENRKQAFEIRLCSRLLNILYKDHITNQDVRRKIKAAIGEYDELLTTVVTSCCLPWTTYPSKMVYTLKVKKQISI